MSLGNIVTVELGGKTRRLIYDFNALCALEEDLDLPIVDLVKYLTGKVRLKDLRNILRVGLLHDEPSLTAEQVGSMITDIQDFDAIGKSIKASLESAFPPAPPATVINKKSGRPRKN